MGLRQLVLTTTVAVVVLVACEASFGAHGAPEVHPRDAYARQVAGGAVIVDVRTRREYARAHIVGAVNIPLDEVGSRVDELRQLAGQRDVILYCRTGRRTAIAEPILRSGGVSNILHLSGQLAGWAAEGLPVIRGG